MSNSKLILLLLASLFLFGCLNDNKYKATPEAIASAGKLLTSITTPQPLNGHTYLLGSYSILVDPDQETLEIKENLTFNYGLNVCSFMREIPYRSPALSAKSISFNKQDPDCILLNIEFQWNHPIPSEARYQVYDFLGIIELNSTGNLALDYLGLTYPQSGKDITLVNADTYTVWFNTRDFMRSLFFGNPPPDIIYHDMPNSVIIQPAKYYSTSLLPDENLWNFLVNQVDDNEGLYDSGYTRQYELLLPKSAIDSEGKFYFMYLAMCRWNDKMDSPQTPCHREEAIACSVNVTDNIYYDGSESGGDLILDIGLWAWDEQPSVVMIESTVFSSTKTVTDPPRPGGDNYSIYHFDEPIDMPLDSTEGQEFWIIAESSGYTYGLQEGLYGSTNPLAAFFRYPLHVASEPYNAE
jgi:hypothetical protein